MPLTLAKGSKVRTADAAAALIEDGDCITVSGSVTAMLPSMLLRAIEVRFLETGTPRGLTWFEPFPTGNPGIEPLSYPGLLKRVIGGWYTPHPRLREMINAGDVEAYLFPLGSLSFWCQAMAAGRDFYLTKVGLETYLDPRNGGGRLNDATKEELVSIEEVRGEQFIAYPRLRIDAAIIRGTTVDEEGNLALDDEQVTMNILYQALAAKRFGGKVIVQAKRLIGAGLIPPRSVALPGHLVDAIVIDPEQQSDDLVHTIGLPRLSDRIERPPSRVLASDQKEAWREWLTERRVEESTAPSVRRLTPDILVGRRASLELRPGDVVNVGAGLPLREIPSVAVEEEIDGDVELSVESGALGGLLNGTGFRANIRAILDTPGIFSLYGANLIGTAFFSMLEFDPHGNVNLLRYGDTWVGPGGSMDIAETVDRIVFCGTMRAGGLDAEGIDGRLVIRREGSVARAVPHVQGVCFNGDKMLRQGKDVIYVTERAVFRLTEDGLELIEVAPGIDRERDVLGQMQFRPKVAPVVRTMDARVFTPGPMGVRMGWASRS